MVYIIAYVFASKLLFAYMYLNVYVFTLTLGLLPMRKSIKLRNKWMQLQPMYLLLATKGTMGTIRTATCKCAAG